MSKKRYLDADKLRHDICNAYDLDVCRNPIYEKAVEVIAGQPTITDLFAIDEVAKILYDAFGDPCACNFNCNDEWLPYVCKHADDCPDPPDDLACWCEYLEHIKERPEL